ncbi:14384_t:CDS:2, partial [Entrophospora sp. SA101]
MEGIPVPVPVSTPIYQKFEENNPEVSLCVYKWSNENKRLEFQYIYKEVNLLVISEPDEIENPRSHYCIIKDIHRLVYNHSKHKERKYLCQYCLHECSGINGAPQEPKVPKLEKSTKAFYNHKCMPNPYRIFWDLECLTTKLTPEEKAQLTRPDALEKFVDKLEIELAEIQTDLSTPAEMVMEPGDYTRHRMATECWICKKEFPNQNMLKTMVCCPNTGNYKGASHQGCKRKNEIIGPKWYQQPSIPDNGIFKEAYKLPLECHNYRGYDCHILMEIVAKFTADKIKCIPENIGKYKAMDVGQLRFLDSFQHMSMGLEKLVATMDGNLEKFPLTIKHFTDKGYTLDQIKFLFRKGVFPYDWTNSWDKFEKTALPRRKDFYSILNQQNISKADYSYAQEVWKKFEMKNFGEYHDLYLETDVLLLADVFMNYTIMCLKDNGLDPSHYVSAPGMFNDSLYKSSGAEIKLITDMDQYLLVEKGIRGSMSMVSQRYAKANNPQCPDYDESKPNSW